jgi:hypothetical protein
LIPGRPPRRSGLSRTRDLEPRVASEPKLGGISEETGRGGGYATTGVVRVWLLSLNRSEEQVSRAAPQSPVSDRPK